MPATSNHTESSFILRPLRIEDAPFILQGRNSDQVRPHMLTQHLITAQEHQSWMEKRIANHAEMPYFLFLHHEIPLGIVGLSHFDKSSKSGEWGFYIWAPDAPKYSGTYMLSAFLDEIFLRRGLLTLSAQVLGSNSRSLHLHRKLGFTQKNTLKEAIVIGNIPQDIVPFEITRAKWESHRTFAFIPVTTMTLQKMKILYLGYHESPLVDFLRARGEILYITEKKCDLDFIKNQEFDFLISYGYRYIISPAILSYFAKGKAINLHISFLPWNRGAHPNLWSLWDGTPTGVTIHCIDEGLDTGDVIIQQNITVADTETLRSSYNLLHRHIQQIFIANWDKIRAGQCIFTRQPTGGSLHKAKELERIQNCMPDGWETLVSDFLNCARKQKLAGD